MGYTTSLIIENEIKSVDKAMQYSIKSKDVELSQQFIKFENFVSSEQLKQHLKEELSELLFQKSNYFYNLLDGLKHIEDVKQKVIKINCDVQKIKSYLLKELDQYPEDIHYLKLLSILKLRLQNNIYGCIELENQINEIISKAQNQEQDQINAFNMQQGSICSIIIGFKTGKTTLHHFSDSTPKFFGYNKKEFQQFNNIDILMPKVLADNHDNFLNRLVFSGKPKIIRKYRDAHGKNKKGFIFGIKLYVNYYWGIQNDFCVSALALKNQNQNMLTLILDNQGFIHEISQDFFDQINFIYPEVEPDDLKQLNIYSICQEAFYDIKLIHKNTLQKENQENQQFNQISSKNKQQELQNKINNRKSHAKQLQINFPKTYSFVFPQNFKKYLNNYHINKKQIMQNEKNLQIELENFDNSQLSQEKFKFHFVLNVTISQDNFFQNLKTRIFEFHIHYIQQDTQKILQTERQIEKMNVIFKEKPENIQPSKYNFDSNDENSEKSPIHGIQLGKKKKNSEQQVVNKDFNNFLNSRAGNMETQESITNVQDLVQKTGQQSKFFDESKEQHKLLVNQSSTLNDKPSAPVQLHTKIKKRTSLRVSEQLLNQEGFANRHSKISNDLGSQSQLNIALELMKNSKEETDDQLVHQLKEKEEIIKTQKNKNQIEQIQELDEEQSQSQCILNTDIQQFKSNHKSQLKKLKSPSSSSISSLSDDSQASKKSNAIINQKLKSEIKTTKSKHTDVTTEEAKDIDNFAEFTQINSSPENIINEDIQDFKKQSIENNLIQQNNEHNKNQNQQNQEQSILNKNQQQSNKSLNIESPIKSKNNNIDDDECQTILGQKDNTLEFQEAESILPSISHNNTNQNKTFNKIEEIIDQEINKESKIEKKQIKMLMTGDIDFNSDTNLKLTSQIQSQVQTNTMQQSPLSAQQIDVIIPSSQQSNIKNSEQQIDVMIPASQQSNFKISQQCIDSQIPNIQNNNFGESEIVPEDQSNIIVQIPQTNQLKQMSQYHKSQRSKSQKMSQKRKNSGSEQNNSVLNSSFQRNNTIQQQSEINSKYSNRNLNKINTHVSQFQAQQSIQQDSEYQVPDIFMQSKQEYFYENSQSEDDLEDIQQSDFEDMMTKITKIKVMTKNNNANQQFENFQQIDSDSNSEQNNDQFDEDEEDDNFIALHSDSSSENNSRHIGDVSVKNMKKPDQINQMLIKQIDEKENEDGEINDIQKHKNENYSMFITLLHEQIESNNKPFFIKILQQTFIFQGIFFLVIVISVDLILLNQVQEFMDILDYLNFSSKCIQNMTQSSISSNYLALSQLPNTPLVENQANINYFQENLQDSYQNIRDTLDLQNTIKNQLTFQDTYLQQKLPFTYQINQKEFQKEEIIIQIIKTITESMFQLTLSQQNNQIQADKHTLIQNNLIILNDFNDFMLKAFNEDSEQLFSKIDALNIFLFTILSTLYLASFTCIYKPFIIYQQNLEKLLMLSTRISSNEINRELYHLEKTLEFLNSEDEKYLLKKFSEGNYDFVQDNFEKAERKKAKQLKTNLSHATTKISQKSMTMQFKTGINKSVMKGTRQVGVPPSSKGFSSYSSAVNSKKPKKGKDDNILEKRKNKRKKAKYVYDLIMKHSLGKKQIIFLFLMVLASIGSFLVGFIELNQFSKNFHNPLEYQQLIIQGITSIGLISNIQDLDLQNKILDVNNQKQFQFDIQKLEELKQIKNEKQYEIVPFFSNQYLSLGAYSTQTDNFKKLAYEINKNDACLLLLQTQKPFLNQTCSQIMSGGFKNGLQQSVNNIFNTFANRNFEKWNKFQIQQFINDRNYIEENQAIKIILTLLDYLERQLKDDNHILVDRFLYNLNISYFITGGIVILVFILILLVFFKNLNSDYHNIKKGVYFVPHKRVCQDPSTVFLLKRYVIS